MNTIEEWRAVVGYEDTYEVSSHGHVRRIRIARGSGFRKNMKTGPQKDGYLRLSLCRNNQPKQFMVHVLVAEAFLGPCPEGQEVNHKDGIKGNPRLDNLEYVTSKRNSEHATQMGLMPFGTRRTNAKLTDEKVKEARHLYAKGWTQERLAEKFGVSRRTIGDAVTGRLWKHVK